MAQMQKRVTANRGTRRWGFPQERMKRKLAKSIKGQDQANSDGIFFFKSAERENLAGGRLPESTGKWRRGFAFVRQIFGHVSMIAGGSRGALSDSQLHHDYEMEGGK
ncbi:hypothetical protein NPIL_698261 [Nephila pilipes]|uniref:Uncharacterized protein n=1 Tax=Nephila pilipes TaxID=299642 RepID=A0A8X6R0U0_NEPPI|nr:hypothetical protein NPIL_698261 [Nephila pilipes]